MTFFATNEIVHSRKFCLRYNYFKKLKNIKLFADYKETIIGNIFCFFLQKILDSHSKEQNTSSLFFILNICKRCYI